MSAKKFNWSLVLIIPVIFAGYFLAVHYFYFDNKDDSFSVETYFDFKESIADSIQGNKILFASGSNNFLGIRAYQIEEEFKVPTVNMSIHAGLQAEYILHRLKSSVNSGDMVIAPFEYSNLGYTGEPGVTLNKYILSYDKQYVDDHYGLVDRLKLLSSISILDLANSVIFGTTKAEDIEKRANFLKNINRNGDMLNMTQHDSLKTKKNPFALPKPFDVETTGLKAIKEFNRYCKKNNVTFFITFPNLIKDKAYTKKKYQEYFEFLLSYFKSNDIAVIGTPEDAMYPKKLFFDSEYHLISNGSDIRTADFIRLFKENTEATTTIKSMKTNTP